MVDPTIEHHRDEVVIHRPWVGDLTFCRIDSRSNLLRWGFFEAIVEALEVDRDARLCSICEWDDVDHELIQDGELEHEIASCGGRAP